MKKPWRIFASALTVGTLWGACAVVALSGSDARAQSGVATDGNITKGYILSGAGGTWGAAQTQAVIKAGGQIVFGHAGTGIGAAISTDPNFAAKARKSPALTQGDEAVAGPRAGAGRRSLRRGHHSRQRDFRQHPVEHARDRGELGLGARL